jgi:hypothetical protein
VHVQPGEDVVCALSRSVREATAAVAGAAMRREPIAYFAPQRLMPARDFAFGARAVGAGGGSPIP